MQRSQVTSGHGVHVQAALEKGKHKLREPKSFIMGSKQDFALEGDTVYLISMVFTIQTSLTSCTSSSFI